LEYIGSYYHEEPLCGNTVATNSCSKINKGSKSDIWCTDVEIKSQIIIFYQAYDLVAVVHLLFISKKGIGIE